jgi:hypothetical protein
VQRLRCAPLRARQSFSADHPTSSSPTTAAQPRRPLQPTHVTVSFVASAYQDSFGSTVPVVMIAPQHMQVQPGLMPGMHTALVLLVRLACIVVSGCGGAWPQLPARTRMGAVNVGAMHVLATVTAAAIGGCVHGDACSVFCLNKLIVHVSNAMQGREGLSLSGCERQVVCAAAWAGGWSCCVLCHFVIWASQHLSIWGNVWKGL